MTTATAKKSKASSASTTPQSITLPALGKGEHYAGIVIADGKPSHHLILLPGGAESVTWAQAKAWAEKSGGELPTRQEQSILFGNAKAQFQPRWYWSSEQCAGNEGYAWGQYFGNGDQYNDRKGLTFRARAVRRLVIQSFTNSIATT